MANQQNNQNKSKKIKQQQSNLQKRSRIMTMILLPFVLISSFFGLIFFWIDNRRHISKKRNRNHDKYIQFSMLSFEEEYAKQSDKIG